MISNKNEPSFYVLDEMRNCPWGDYGSILINGMCACATDKTIKLRRTGPFIPPISFPPGGFGAIIVTDSLKKELVHSGLAGLTFHEIDKELIVELNWQDWDRDSPCPAEYPSGEPEDYIINKHHSPKAAEQMGLIWEARSKRLVECTSKVGELDEPMAIVITTDPEVLEQVDIFRTKYKSGLIFFSEKAKQWLSHKVPDWVQFRRVYLMDHRVF